MSLLRTKSIEQSIADTDEPEYQLKRSLSALDLTVFGVGVVIGAGIFTLTGRAAHSVAGPAIVISFVIAALACALAAMCYAEFASTVPVSGSAYTFSYASLGEIFAWIIGWDLILEYSVAVSAVAIGWSGYANTALEAVGLGLPPELLRGPLEGGLVNLPAFVIVLVLGLLLAVGVRESARVNAVMVFIKLLAIGVFVAIASSHVEPANWSPFMPFGWGGMMGGAALVIFAYLGFDAVSTAAEEARNPQRDLPIGILASLAVCTLLYILVAGLLTGVAHYSTLNVSDPVAEVILRLGYPWGAGLVAAGAIAGLTTVMLAMYYGLTRVFLAIARDGLLPPLFARIDRRTQTPLTVILATGFAMAFIAGFTPISAVAKLVNLGTLAAFFLVSVGVLVLRRRHPDLPRPFRIPFSPLFPLLGAFFCLILALSLPWQTWAAFGVWLAIGFVIYFVYSRHHSALAVNPESLGNGSLGSQAN